ncbi:general secretion pathway protein GspE [Endozoicomonas montiporae]|uniref:General secretion pathway protein GspE n=2 Tax=Endozoicomonas montiporae TaxID=1027273 RepID=A0A081N2Z6_9GAMM|nr:type IV-A pilus assembly ATPase PilB [Endozoicomonas montiporae]AMO58090.1 type 4 pili assembly protein PilB [Endozoicomonas montiporae CL-33]KEQ12819.1 general secretion pathway protein GspE [Endozoicomonas montiporae]
MADKPLNGLAARLVVNQLVDEKAVRSAQTNADKAGKTLNQQLVEDKLLTYAQLALVTAEEFGIPVIDISAFDPENVPSDLVKEKLVRKHKVMPLIKRGTRLFVAVVNPADHQAIDEIRFSSGLATEPVLVEENKMEAFIDRVIDGSGSGLDDFDDDEFENLDDLEVSAVDDGGEDYNGPAEDDAPVVKFVNKMLLSAIKGGASDLHFEPYEKSYRVRFRTDGVLHEVAKPPVNLSPRIASRLKIMSAMDISERRKPQDGRIKMKLSKSKAIDFRVNTLPTLWGEKIVLRILDPSSAKMGIDALGYEEEQKAMYLEALEQPQGMILVTGPTGSGKTVSLYTGLNILNTPERNISTSEDPVEINLEGINQVNVNPKQGMDFSQALRAFLRQDPDIIMVGEIRDLETANIAIKAAQTGHMVMSTLHTNSAPETLTRLQNMGVPSFNIATSVSLIIAQRLARRLCTNCKVKVDIPKETLMEEGFTDEQASEAVIYGPEGCDQCSKGYKGRVGIYEVVKITPSMQQVIMEEGNSLEIAKVAEKEGFNNLRQSGLLKALQGITSLEEVNRVTLD